MNFSLALVYVAFFAVIGLAVYFTGSPWALLGMIFMPEYKTYSDSDSKSKDEDKDEYE